MKALILHQHFTTPERGGALRSYFLAKALAARGTDVVVITAHNEPFVKKNIEGIEVFFLNIPYQNSFGFYKRIWSFVRFLLQSARIGSQISNLSVCYAMSTPLTTGLAGVYIKWIRRVPLVFETGDLWPDAPIELGIIKNWLLVFLLRRLERFIYRQSKALVALSGPMQKILERRSHRPVHLVPNMADVDFFSPAATSPKAAFDAQNKFTIAYIGSIGFANGLDNLLDCAIALQRASLPVQVVICGNGAMIDHLQAMAKKKSIDNLHFTGFVNRDGVRNLLHTVQAIFVSYQHHPILETGSPNKYFDGLAAGKLIICNFGGWIKEEVEREGCGFSIDSNNPGEIVLKLENYLYSPELLSAAQERSRRFSETYSRKNLSDKFVDIIHQTANAGDR